MINKGEIMTKRIGIAWNKNLWLYLYHNVLTFNLKKCKYYWYSREQAEYCEKQEILRRKWFIGIEFEEEINYD